MFCEILHYILKKLWNKIMKLQNNSNNKRLHHASECVSEQHLTKTHTHTRSYSRVISTCIAINRRSAGIFRTAVNIKCGSCLLLHHPFLSSSSRAQNHPRNGFMNFPKGRKRLSSLMVRACVCFRFHVCLRLYLRFCSRTIHLNWCFTRFFSERQAFWKDQKGSPSYLQGR